MVSDKWPSCNQSYTFGILQWKQLGGAGGWVGIGSIESALLLGGLEKVEDVDWVVVLC